MEIRKANVEFQLTAKIPYTIFKFKGTFLKWIFWKFELLPTSNYLVNIWKKFYFPSFNDAY